jgi:hypothetical protein
MTGRTISSDSKMVQPTSGRLTGPRRRISAADLATAKGVLEDAALVIEPDDQQQRQAFEKLMPQLYVLRNKGCSFEQLAKLLGQTGFNLQPSTVRTYYNEMLATRAELCQARMNEQLAVMAALRKKEAAAQSREVSNRVEALLAMQRQNNAGRIESVLTGIVGGDHAKSAPNQPPPAPLASQSVPAADAPPVSPTAAPATHPSTPIATSAAGQHHDGTRPNGGQGKTSQRAPRLAQQAATQPVSSPAAQQPEEDARPAVAAAAQPPSGEAKRLRALQPGIAPLKPRDAVPPEVYQEGLLEHPAIEGLMLTLQARLYGAALEYVVIDGGEIMTETPEEKRRRVTWRKPVPVTNTRTGDTFTKMDTALFQS